MGRKHKWPKGWRYAMMPCQMLFKENAWKELSPAAKLIYLYLKGKFNPGNNGKIRLYHSELKDHCGLKNPNTRCNAFKELEEGGWIKRIQLGGLYRHFNEYEITGKYDPSLNWLNTFYNSCYKN